MTHIFRNVVRPDDNQNLESKVMRIAEVAIQNMLNFDCTPTADGLGYEVHASTDDHIASTAYVVATSELFEPVIHRH